MGGSREVIWDTTTLGTYTGVAPHQNYPPTHPPPPPPPTPGAPPLPTAVTDLGGDGGHLPAVVPHSAPAAGEGGAEGGPWASLRGHSSQLFKRTDGCVQRAYMDIMEELQELGRPASE